MAGLPGAPGRSFWERSEKRGVYSSLLEIGGKIELYVGKAGGLGSTHKGYRDFNGRAKGYMETRRMGKIYGREVPHTRAIRDCKRWKLRLTCTSEDDCAVQKILVFEELMTVCLRSFKRNDEYNGRRTVQMCNLVEACTPSELPDWDHVGLNATFQSVGGDIHAMLACCSHDNAFPARQSEAHTSNPEQANELSARFLQQNFDDMSSKECKFWNQ